MRVVRPASLDIWPAAAGRSYIGTIAFKLRSVLAARTGQFSDDVCIKSRGSFPSQQRHFLEPQFPAPEAMSDAKLIRSGAMLCGTEG